MGFQTHYPINLANQDIKVPLRNASNNANFVALVAFLKEFSQQKASASVSESKKD